MVVHTPKLQSVRTLLCVTDGVQLPPSSLLLTDDGLSVAAVMDPGRITSNAQLKELGGPPVYSAMHEVPHNLGYDALLTTSPLAVNVAKRALKHGKHIIAIRRYATPWPEYEAMAKITLAQKASVVFARNPQDRVTFRVLSELMAHDPNADLDQVRCEVVCPPFAGAADVTDGKRVSLFEAAFDTVAICRYLLGDVYTVSADTGAEKLHAMGDFLANMILSHERGMSIHHIRSSNVGPASERYQVERRSGVIEMRLRGNAYVSDAPTYQVSVHRNSQREPLMNVAELKAKLVERVDASLPYHRFIDGVNIGDGTSSDISNAVKVAEVIQAATVAAIEGAKQSLPLVNHRLNKLDVYRNR